MKNLLFLLIVITLLTSLGCSSCKKNITDSNGLPSATQNGAKTLGFLLNGQPWTPQGYTGNANLSVDIDFGLRNGGFDIAAECTINHKTEQFTVGISDSLNFLAIPVTLYISDNGVLGATYTKDTCYYSKDNFAISSGSLTITKLDKARRIFSGVFNFSFTKNGCGNINITDGRFDMPY